MCTTADAVALPDRSREPAGRGADLVCSAAGAAKNGRDGELTRINHKIGVGGMCQWRPRQGARNTRKGQPAS